MLRIGQVRRAKTILVLASFFIQNALLTAPLAVADSTSPSEGVDAPHLNDARYTISLFADAPAIRTPIGAAVDKHDRLFVIESHTISPPPDYAGPKTDRIKIFVDEDRDGKPDQAKIFAEDLKSGMNLTIAPDGVVYVAASRAVLRLSDTDGDGRADQRTSILQVQTPDTNPLGYLIGPVIGPDGWLYVSFDEFFIPWKLIGSDGSMIEGGGGGDGVFRCRTDGTELERVATGFFNPFAMTLDEDGRLLIIDNDPISRGPNRLVHVVPGADYGHRFLYGLAGNHPLNGWNGNLPGTLPPIGAVGETPGGLMVCAVKRFPSNFASSLLVSTWGSNAIERHELTWKGNGAKVNRSVWIQGGSDFRPIALAQDSHGVVYITDWVVNDHYSHGHGRIWRVSPKKDLKLTSPKNPTRMWQLHAPQTKDGIQRALKSADPVERHGGALSLAESRFADLAAKLAKNPDPRLRLGALVAIRRSARVDAVAFCREFLSDRDEAVRHAAVVWVGQEQLSELRDDLDHALTVAMPSQRLLEAWLGAVSVLNPEFVELCRIAKNQAAVEALPSTLPDSLTHALLRDATWTADLRTRVLPWIEDAARDETALLFLTLATREKAPMNVAALRRLTAAKLPSVDERLIALALDSQHSVPVRCEAVATLARRGSMDTRLLALLEDNNAALAIEVIDALRGSLSRPEIKIALDEIAELERGGQRARVQSEAIFVLQTGKDTRPASLTGWQELLATGGDPAQGARRFFSPQTACSSCHAVRGFGGAVGPDLSNVGQSMNRMMIIRSIIRPSDYFAPKFQSKVLVTQQGQIHSGIVLRKDANNTTLQTANGTKMVFPAGDIDSLTPQRLSIMPEGLEATLSIEGLRDLVAFLSTLK